jgi:hypothetical protein
MSVTGTSDRRDVLHFREHHLYHQVCNFWSVVEPKFWS